MNSEIIPILILEACMCVYVLFSAFRSGGVLMTAWISPYHFPGKLF